MVTKDRKLNDFFFLIYGNQLFYEHGIHITMHPLRYKGSLLKLPTFAGSCVSQVAWNQARQIYGSSCGIYSFKNSNYFRIVT